MAGVASAQTSVNPSDAGYISDGGVKELQGPTGNFFSGRTNGGIEYRGYLTYSVPTSATPYSSAVLNLNVRDIVAGPNDLLVSDVTSNIATAPGTTVFADLGSGVSYGTVTGLNTTNATIQITLNAAGLSAVNAARGGSLSFGFRNTTVESTNDQIFGFSGGSTPRQLILTAGPSTVPTLSEWAMILFGLTLAGGAALFIQRRRLTA